MRDLYCDDCGTIQGTLQAVAAPHFGRYCAACLAAREKAIKSGRGDR